MHRPGVIIIDDEPELLVELAEWFETQGWRVETGHSAGDALRLLNGGAHVHCLITDLLMPGESGDKLLQQLRSLPKSAQPDLFAIMTGEEAHSEAHRSSNADVIFFKPVDPSAMLNSIAGHLRNCVGRGTDTRSALVESA